MKSANAPGKGKGKVSGGGNGKKSRGKKKASRGKKKKIQSSSSSSSSGGSSIGSDTTYFLDPAATSAPPNPFECPPQDSETWSRKQWNQYTAWMQFERTYRTMTKEENYYLDSLKSNPDKEKKPEKEKKPSQK
ncbi:hypothetical protein EUTSA_v10026552mg [Eutrema salsugineum]|uniref:Uncharacterized protein n=1 Tax=Eutrema salsugineum TaxID=72664 RepID=V4MFU5_EUTSA|nr:uncharacterized protein LOC18029705 [Eutrema salsugineum]ESQ55374.1 hypothetical protein EUTSA_v10026552mg [Eutrema salsugineum]